MIKISIPQILASNFVLFDPVKVKHNFLQINLQQKRKSEDRVVYHSRHFYLHLHATGSSYSAMAEKHCILSLIFINLINFSCYQTKGSLPYRWKSKYLLRYLNFALKLFNTKNFHFALIISSADLSHVD